MSWNLYAGIKTWSGLVYEVSVSESRIRIPVKAFPGFFSQFSFINILFQEFNIGDGPGIVELAGPHFVDREYGVQTDGVHDTERTDLHVHDAHP